MCFDQTGKILVTGLIDGRVTVWSVARRQWVATFLAVSQYKWMTYTREGYFIGSNDVEGAVSMYFGRGGRSYPAGVLMHPRDNPNPEKIAAALALTEADSEAETTARAARSATKVEPPKLLGTPEP
jgi:hypothetical protein